MAVKDISDSQIIRACIKAHANPSIRSERSIEILMDMTEQCVKVCFRAMERAYSRGYIECGVSLCGAWATQKGRDLITHKPLLELDQERGTTDTETLAA